MEERSKQSNLFPNGRTFKSELCSNIPQPSSTIMEEEPSEQYCVIPDDVLFKEILPKIPTKSLLRFKRVSKSWMARISSDSAFIADHTAHHSTAPTEYTIMCGSRLCRPNRFNDPHIMCGCTSLFILSHRDSQIVEIDTRHIIERPKFMNLAGACNGLACVYFGFNSECFKLAIWNPVTRVHTVLPELTYSRRCSPHYYFGFGKDSCIDYKVVRLMTNEKNIIEVHLFTKSTGRWRQLNDLSAGFEFPYNRKGLTVDGTMYWKIRRPTSPHRSFFQEYVLGILSFDLCTEKFHELELPTHPGEEGWKLLELIKWKSCLAAVLADKCRTQVQLWLRTDNDDGNENRNFCWKNIAINRFERLLDDCDIIKDQLIKDGRDSNFFDMFDHMPSFVSPH